MISLLLTLFISVFSFCPSINRLEDHNENTIILSDSKPVNYFFTDDSGDDELAYVYSLSDICNERFYWDIRDYFYHHGYNITTDSSVMPFNTIYTLPIRICYYGDFTDFDYASGYDYIIHEVYDINYIKVRRSISDGSTTFFNIGFVTAENSNIWGNLSIDFRVVNNFDYVVGTKVYYNGELLEDTSKYCIVGISSDGNSFYPILPDIITSIGDREHNLTDYNAGFAAGQSKGYQEGYNQAIEDNQSYDTTASTIFNGALEIGLLPVNFFLSIFNFEVFGINIKSIVSALLTLAVVIIIVRFLFGGKENDK